MMAEKKLAQQRLSLLELAEALGSVSEACRRRGVSRTRLYEYKRRFQTHGIEGLKDLPPIAKSRPMTTPEAVVARVLEIALEHPAWGCRRLSARTGPVNETSPAPRRHQARERGDPTACGGER